MLHYGYCTKDLKMFETLYTFRNGMSAKFPKVPAKVLHPVADLVVFLLNWKLTGIIVL